jgi:hypothetical protein
MKSKTVPNWFIYHCYKNIFISYHITCWSVSGPRRSDLSAFLTGVRLGQYSVMHLVHRYPPILSSWVNGIGLVLRCEQKYFRGCTVGEVYRDRVIVHHSFTACSNCLFIFSLSTTAWLSAILVMPALISSPSPKSTAGIITIVNVCILAVTI